MYIVYVYIDLCIRIWKYYYMIVFIDFDFWRLDKGFFFWGGVLEFMIGKGIELIFVFKIFFFDCVFGFFNLFKDIENFLFIFNFDFVLLEWCFFFYWDFVFLNLFCLIFGFFVFGGSFFFIIKFFILWRLLLIVIVILNSFRSFGIFFGSIFGFFFWLLLLFDKDILCWCFRRFLDDIFFFLFLGKEEGFEVVIARFSGVIRYLLKENLFFFVFCKFFKIICLIWDFGEVIMEDELFWIIVWVVCDLEFCLINILFLFFFVDILLCVWFLLREFDAMFLEGFILRELIFV